MAVRSNFKGGIDPEQPLQVEYVHKQFPWLSQEEIEHAIREKGPNPERVLSYLQHRGQGSKK